MNKRIIGSALFLAASLLWAENMDLVTFSDLRLRNEAVSKQTIFGTWHVKGAQRGESIVIDSKRISGSDGCNRFSASLMIAEEELTIGSIMSTRVHCENLQGSDERFRITLARIVAYRLLDNGELHLLDGEGKALIQLVR